MTQAVPERMLSRRVVVTIIVALVLLLCALFAYLFGLMRANTVAPMAPVAGLEPVLTLYGPGVGAKPLFDSPMAASFGPTGTVYVADTGNNRIVVFDSSGRYLRQWGGLGVAKPAAGGVKSWRPGLFNYPTDVEVDAQGNVYVADFRNDQIQVYDANGVFIRRFPNPRRQVGRGASGDGGVGIAVTSLAVKEGRVFVTDRYQVVEFTTDGQFVRQFGRPGSGKTDFDHPNGIAVGPLGQVVVSDSNHNRVVGLTPRGGYLWSVGGPLGMGIDATGTPVQLPRGIATLGDQGFIVADALTSTLVKLSRTGDVVGTFGERGVAPAEFNFPTDVAASGDLLVVAEKGSNRVQVVRFARQ